MTEPVDALLWQITASQLPAPVTEHRFHPKRRWRFDLCWPARRIALEVEGGIWVGGRHTRPAGYQADCEKYSEAAVLGWRILRVTPGMIHNGTAIDLVQRALEREVTP